ncbi:cell surface glycoprotein CD200 receptor 1-like [Suncus etruscus]|uniref:cell surface glycoprotein CD200 receptor 1-like n=1 Tax=Suncus etruscus TaxID=109475 RepID=UPI002110CAAD|nr:cell surface glycoprotein CD200 receptor 1-like [Suncus etruscus]
MEPRSATYKPFKGTDQSNVVLFSILYYTYLTASVGTKVVLFCQPICSDYVILATWGIDLGGKFNCSIAYHPEKNETNSTCHDKGLTWFSRPDQNTSLQIDPVAVSHEGNYSCEIVTLDGNFHHYYHLQVLGKEHHVL